MRVTIAPAASVGSFTLRHLLAKLECGKFLRFAFIQRARIETPCELNEGQIDRHDHGAAIAAR